MHDKIHLEIEKIFRNLERKPIERNSKRIYGIIGDITKIGTEKSENVWFIKMKTILDGIKIGDERILRGSYYNLYVKRSEAESWESAFLSTRFKPNANDELSNISTSNLLRFLYEVHAML
ncbi:MAG: hypothetical protein V1763_02740 [Parcubacteria group bacterium]